MIPEKSLSFAMAVGEAGDFGAIKLGDCESCAQVDCSYRTEVHNQTMGDTGR